MDGNEKLGTKSRGFIYCADSNWRRLMFFTLWRNYLEIIKNISFSSLFHHSISSDKVKYGVGESQRWMIFVDASLYPTWKLKVQIKMTSTRAIEFSGGFPELIATEIFSALTVFHIISWKKWNSPNVYYIKIFHVLTQLVFQCITHGNLPDRKFVQLIVLKKRRQ